ncbi:MAG: hypothetical protein QOJ52_3834, partial [Acidimicrobiaceae bacterium]|nr:hypothetical protein [Acidimicrobiaceae bacterium]
GRLTLEAVAGADLADSYRGHTGGTP